MQRLSLKHKTRTWVLVEFPEHFVAAIEHTTSHSIPHIKLFFNNYNFFKKLKIF